LRWAAAWLERLSVQPTVSLCRAGTRFRSLIADGLGHGASAAFCCLSPASARSSRCTPANRATVSARQDEAVSQGGWGRIRRAGQRVQFGGHADGFGRADQLQDRQRLPQPRLGLGGAAGGLGAPAQAGQRVRLLQRDAGLAGQVQGLVACPGLAEVTADPAQRPGLVKSRDFSVRAGDLTGDVQRLLQVTGRGRIVPVSARALVTWRAAQGTSRR
jgi:hypothetical protein